MELNTILPRTTTDFFYGWNLLYSTVQSNIVKKSDVLIALAHFMLTKHEGFRCVGLGDETALKDNLLASELLPDGWNLVEEKYSLRYVQSDTLYLLLGHLTDDALIVNLLNVSNKKVSNLCLNPNKLVASLEGNINKLMPKINGIAYRYRTELLEPVYTGKYREVFTQTFPTIGARPDYNTFPSRAVRSNHFASRNTILTAASESRISPNANRNQANPNSFPSFYSL